MFREFFFDLIDGMKYYVIPNKNKNNDKRSLEDMLSYHNKVLASDENYLKRDLDVTKAVLKQIEDIISDKETVEQASDILGITKDQFLLSQNLRIETLKKCVKLGGEIKTTEEILDQAL